MLNDSGDQRTVSVDGYNCIFCGRCADACPEKALALNFEGKEVAEGRAGAARENRPEPLRRRESADGRHDLELQRCSVCGEIMPVTEKYLKVVRQRTLDNLKPETAKVIDKDMEKYLTACIACRQKCSLIWGTHPRKWVEK